MVPGKQILNLTDKVLTDGHAPVTMHLLLLLKGVVCQALLLFMKPFNFIM